MKIELEHKQLTNAVLKVNGKELPVDRQNCIFAWTISDQNLDIEIAFEPQGLNPILRIDGFLINHWLGNILLMNHAVTFKLCPDYFKQYQQKDLQGRLESIGSNPTSITVDRVIGRSMHQDLVDKIKEKLSEKSNIS
jgi:hypothetical protein